MAKSLLLALAAAVLMSGVALAQTQTIIETQPSETVTKTQKTIDSNGVTVEKSRTSSSDGETTTTTRTTGPTIPVVPPTSSTTTTTTKTTTE